MKSGTATADGSTEFWDQEISLKDTFVFTAPEENEHLTLKVKFPWRLTMPDLQKKWLCCGSQATTSLIFLTD